MKEIKQIKKYYNKEKTRGGKDKWVLDEIEEYNIPYERYFYLVRNNNPFGYERQTKSHTNIGYVVTKITCISPDKQNKITYDFIIE